MLNRILSSIIYICHNFLKFLYRNARSFDLQTKGTLASALVQCHFDYVCGLVVFQQNSTHNRTTPNQGTGRFQRR